MGTVVGLWAKDGRENRITLAGNYLGITRYVRGFQSRRSLLIWKVFGRRTDGFPEKPRPGQEALHKQLLAAGDFSGSVMPPPEAV